MSSNVVTPVKANDNDDVNFDKEVNYDSTPKKRMMIAVVMTTILKKRG